MRGGAPAGMGRGGCGPGPGHHHHGRRRGRIFWRVYGHGLLMLLCVALAVAGGAWVLGRYLPPREPGRMARYAAHHFAELMSHPDQLEAELQRVREGFGLEASVYDERGALVASNVDPPLEPVPPADLRPLEDGPRHVERRGFAFAALLPNGRGHVVITGAPREGLALRAAAFIAIVLLVLAVGSIPMARSITSPVERLTGAARALGAGDLAVRSGVRAPGEVGELAAAFDEMAARLERLVRGEKELLANVSHELRTPMARIRLALALAEEGDVARARQALGEIGEDLGELERLVEEILAAARLDLAGPGGLPLHRAPLEVRGLLEDAAARFRARHEGRALSLEADGDLPAPDADAALLRRLLGNLLDNAAKYSDAAEPVTLAARAADGALVLEVRDRGIGVEPADLPRLFTPFFRTDRSRARGTGGVGLGLAL
ncbi:MAG TPA: HAMP domain-containing sensor histidine kinase, partial [Anaeromyxobacteraceae bacterium]